MLKDKLWSLWKWKHEDWKCCNDRESYNDRKCDNDPIRESIACISQNVFHFSICIFQNIFFLWLLITLFKCLKGQKSLGLLFYVKNKKVSQWVISDMVTYWAVCGQLKMSVWPKKLFMLFWCKTCFVWIYALLGVNFCLWNVLGVNKMTNIRCVRF